MRTLLILNDPPYGTERAYNDSPVLSAMGVEREWGMGTLRLSVGRYTTEDEVDEAIRVITAGVRDAAPADVGEVPHA